MTTSDLAIIKEMFLNYARLSKVLEVKDDLTNKIEEYRKKIAPISDKQNRKNSRK